MIKKLLATVILMALFGSSVAQSAPVQATIKGGTCWGNLSLKAVVDPATVFACEHIGKVTIAQIYEKGFRVISVMHNPAHPGFVSLIIEEQR